MFEYCPASLLLLATPAFVLLQASAASPVEHLSVENKTITLPKPSRYMSGEHILCTPSTWASIIAFFLANYVSHAATVKFLPGESKPSCTIAILHALMFPTSGVTRGLNAIFQHSIFCRTPLETACRSGALCVVVRTEDWKPRDGEVVKGVWLEEEYGREQGWRQVTVPLSQEDGENEISSHPKSAGKDAFIRLPQDVETRAFFGRTTGNLLVHDPHTTNSGTTNVQTAPQVEESTGDPVNIPGTNSQAESSCRINVANRTESLPNCGVWNIGRGARTPLLPATHGVHKRSRVIHGTCHLPPGYALSVLHHETKITKSAIDDVPSKQVRDRTSFDGRQTPEWILYFTVPHVRWAAGHHPQVHYSHAISMSHSLSKALVAIFQAIYASVTLYETRGDQIQHYGYAAFGLTVAPYLVMSLLNLISNILTPDFPAMYLMRNDIMDEAAKREGGHFEGIVGSVDDAYHENSIDVTFRTDQGKIFMRSTGRHARVADQSSVAEQTRDENCTVDSDSMEVQHVSLREIDVPSFIAIPSNSVNGNSGEQSETAVTAVLLGACIVSGLVIALVGGLSRFQAGSSSVAQRVWTMVWLGFGIFAGSQGQYVAFQRRMIGRRVSKTRNHPVEEKVTTMTLRLFLYSSPAIGGFVVVAQMLKSYGQCVKLY
jgi:hypothetical protein